MITEQLLRQAELLNHLHRELNELEVRLHTVLEPADSDGENGDKTPSQVQLVHVLRDHNETLGVAVRRIVELRNRLHVC